MITLFECRAKRPMENITKLNTLLVIIDEEKERAGKEERQRREKKHLENCTITCYQTVSILVQFIQITCYPGPSRCNELDRFCSSFGH